jgi:DNA polymerase-3 subunit delta
VQIRPEQLARHLQEHLLPLYIVSGEEPLQREECVDLVRATARARQFDEREVLHVERRFEWSTLTNFSDSLSLFASRRILELRVPAKLDDAGRKALAAWTERPPQDVLLLLILTFRVDGQMARAKWFSALEGSGAHVQVWPVAPEQMPAWVQQRARQAGLAIDDDAAALLAERAEGNLLAGAQELMKLALLHRGERVGVEQVIAATADSARYDAFDLVDACFMGDAPRTVRIVRALREEGLRLPEVLGPLAWAMRSAAEIAPAAARGVPLDRALGPRHGAWRAAQRRRALEAVLARHPLERWGRMLRRAGLIDRRAKGDAGRLNWRIRGELAQAWSELESLGLLLAGVSLARPGPYNQPRQR